MTLWGKIAENNCIAKRQNWMDQQQNGARKINAPEETAQLKLLNAGNLWDFIFFCRQ